MVKGSANAPCDPFWGVDIPDRGSIVGAEKVIVIDGRQFPVGRTAVVRRIARGTFNGFVQPSVVNPTKSWHPWTDTTSLTFVDDEPIDTTGLIMFEVRPDGSVWYNGKPVEQTGAPRN